jgi:hypothetical protein
MVVEQPEAVVVMARMRSGGFRNDGLLHSDDVGDKNRYNGS